MLELFVDASSKEFYDEEKQEFFTLKSRVIELEHSLISVSKWESKWKISFLKFIDDKNYDVEKFMDYIRCMTVTPKVDPRLYGCLTQEQILQIADYINDPMTATTFQSYRQNTGRKKILTAEVIYQRMIVNGIWKECERWHLNRLLALIRVAEISNSTNSKSNQMSSQDVRRQYQALNNARRAKYKTRG